MRSSLHRATMLNPKLTLAENDAKYVPRAYINDSTYNALHGPQAVDLSGVTNTDVALQSAINAAAAVVRTHQVSVDNSATSVAQSETFEIPDGEYKLANPIVWPLGINPKFGRNARLKAGSAMGAMFATNKTDRHEREKITDGIFDCNGLATTGISIGYFRHMDIIGVRVENPGGHGMVLGDPTAAATSYEANVSGYDQKQKRDVSVISGGYGVWLQYATDSHIINPEIMGVETGIRNDMPGNTIVRGHVWNSGSCPSGGPLVCFDDNTSNSTYIACYADGPSLYGLLLRNGYASISQMRVTLLLGVVNAAADNTVVGIQSNQAAGAGNFLVVGMRLDGADATHRYKTEIGGEITGAKWHDVEYIGTAPTNVATSIGNRDRSRGARMVNPNPSSSPLILARQQNAAAADLLQITDENGFGICRVTRDFEVLANGYSRNLVRKITNYTFTKTDSIVAWNGVGLTATLPSAAASASANIGTGNFTSRGFTAKNDHASSNLTVNAVSGLVNGSTDTLAPGVSKTYYSDGTNWESF